MKNKKKGKLTTVKGSVGIKDFISVGTLISLLKVILDNVDSIIKLIDYLR